MSQSEISATMVRMICSLREWRKSSAQAPMTLLLGSGASALSQDLLVRRMLLQAGGFPKDQLDAMSAERRHEVFQQECSRFRDQTRFEVFAKILQELREAQEPSYLALQRSHQAIVRLIQRGYFDLVITTSIDYLLEEALATAGVGRDEYQVLISGREPNSDLKRMLAWNPPRIKLLKLHGDTLSRCAVLSEREISDRAQLLEPLLPDWLSRRVLIVGYQPIDETIVQNLPASGDMVFYVNRDPPNGQPIYSRRLRDSGLLLNGKEAEFTSFFPVLLAKLVGDEQEVGLENLEEVGVKISPERVEGALRSNVPLVELLSEEDSAMVLELPSILFSIRYDNDERLSFSVTGALRFESQLSELRRLNPDTLNTLMLSIDRDIAAHRQLRRENRSDSSAYAQARENLRLRIKYEGSRFYGDLFAGSAPMSLNQTLGMAKAKVAADRLELSFVGPRNHLGMPYELLTDEHGPWAVQYPLSRQITGVARATKTETFAELLSTLSRSGEPLRVLLIASGIQLNEPDSEVEQIAKTLEIEAARRKIRLKVDKLIGGQATYGEVAARLDKNSYHIIHYAGHGYFVPRTGEDSHLYFRSEARAAKDKEVMAMPARELALLLRDSRTHFLYLSCCSGAAVGGNHLLDKSDYLGLMDAAIQAGVPSAIGFRWAVPDLQARLFAESFYAALLDTHSLGRAALAARKEIYRVDGNDETWVSSILVVQNP